MYKNLRIISVILSAVFVTAAFIVGTWLDLYWAILCAGLAVLFYCLTLYFKKKQEMKEQDGVQEPEPDYFTPKDEKKD